MIIITKFEHEKGYIIEAEELPNSDLIKEDLENMAYLN